MKTKIMLFLGIFMLVPFASAIGLEIVSTDPSPAEAGDFVDVTFRINNDNAQETLEEVEFWLEDTRFVSYSSPRKTWSQAIPGQSLTTTARLYISEDTPQGDLNLDARISVKGGVQKFTLSLFVEESEAKPILEIGTLKTTPSEILPDTDDNKLTMTLQNLGDRKAELITAQMIPATDDFQESYAYSLRDSVASIDGGAEDEFEFWFDVNTEKQKDLNGILNLKYRIASDGSSESEVITKRLPFIIPMTDTPFLELSEEVQASPFKIGSTDNMLELTIKNKGKKEAKDVRVRIFPDVSQPFAFDRTTRYITAELKPGEEAIVDFEVEVFDSGKERTYPLAVSLESVVGSSRYERQDTINIEVKGSAGGGLPIAWIVIGLVLILSVIIGYLRWKRK